MSDVRLYAPPLAVLVAMLILGAYNGPGADVLVIALLACSLLTHAHEARKR